MDPVEVSALKKLESIEPAFEAGRRIRFLVLENFQIDNLKHLSPFWS